VSLVGYPDLGLQDRVHLLETCWTEVIVCGLMWRSMPFSDCENLVFAPDLYFNKYVTVTITVTITVTSHVLTCI